MRSPLANSDHLDRARQCRRTRDAKREGFVGARVETETVVALDAAARAAGCSRAQLINVILVRWLSAEGLLVENSVEPAA